MLAPWATALRAEKFVPDPDGSRKRNSDAVVDPPKFRIIVADAPMFKAVVAANAFTVVAVAFSSAKVDEPVVIEVVKAGEVPKTDSPDPVSSLSTPASCAELVAANCANVPEVSASPPPAALSHESVTVVPEMLAART